MKVYPDWPCNYAPTPHLVQPQQEEIQANQPGIKNTKVYKSIKDTKTHKELDLDSNSPLDLSEYINKFSSSKGEFLSFLDSFISDILNSKPNEESLEETVLNPIQKLVKDLEDEARDAHHSVNEVVGHVFITVNEFHSFNVDKTSIKSACSSFGISSALVNSIKVEFLEDVDIVKVTIAKAVPF
jgi:hypothetical protein